MPLRMIVGVALGYIASRIVPRNKIVYNTTPQSVYYPDALSVNVGSLRIEHPKEIDGGDGPLRTGIGFKIFIDDVEQRNVKCLTLTMSSEGITELTIELYL